MLEKILWCKHTNTMSTYSLFILSCTIVGIIIICNIP